MATEKNNRFSELIISLLMQSRFVWIPTGFIVFTGIFQYPMGLLIPSDDYFWSSLFIDFSKIISSSCVIFIWTFFPWSNFRTLPKILICLCSVSIIVSGFVIRVFLIRVDTFPLSPADIDQYFIAFYFIGTFVSLFYSQAKFLEWWEAKPVFVPIRSTEIDFIEAKVLPNVKNKLAGAIVLSFVRESVRLRYLAFGALFGVGAIVVLALLAVLFSGQLTVSDQLRTTLKSELFELESSSYRKFINKRDEVDDLLSRKMNYENALDLFPLVSNNVDIMQQISNLLVDLENEDIQEWVWNMLFDVHERIEPDEVEKFLLNVTKKKINFELSKIENKIINESNNLILEKNIYLKHNKRAENIRENLSHYIYEGVRADANSIIASAVTRFGLIIILIFFAQALIYLYRYLIQLSAFYWSRAMALALSNGNMRLIADLSNNFSSQGLSFGRIPKAQVDDLVKVLEKIQVPKK